MLEDLMQFITAHWILSTAFLVVFFAVVFEELRNKRSSSSISPQMATQLINRERALVVDIREHDSYQIGHIVNALNLPQTELLKSTDKLKKYQEKPIILVCKQGQSSGAAAAGLRKKGFQKVYTLAGGISAWKDAGLPITK